MIEYYSRLASKFGGKLYGRYINGISLVSDKNVNGKYVLCEHMGDDIASPRFILTEKPHAKRKEGFPLDSLSMHIASGKYYFDLNDNERYDDDTWHIDKGFRDFFIRTVDETNNTKSKQLK